MLIDAIRLCREKAEDARKAAIENDVASAGLAADQAAFGLLVLEESMREAQYVSLDDLLDMVGISEQRQAIPDDPDEYPEGASDDDPEKELPEEKKRREEFKDRGFYG